MTGSKATAINRHSRTLESGYGFMDLSEHVTWVLDKTVDECDYPMEVTVTVEVEEQ